MIVEILRIGVSYSIQPNTNFRNIIMFLHERPLARPVITGVTEDQHANHRTSKGNGGDILGRRRRRVGVWVELRQNGVDLADYLSA